MKKIGILFVGVMCMLLALAGCSSRAQDDTWGRADATEMDVTSKIAGRVVKIYVKEGDYVKKGQVLAQIDQRDLAAQKLGLAANVESLQAQRVQAEVVTDLQAGTTQADVDAAASAIAQAASNLDLARADYARYAALLEQGAIAQQTFDSAKTKYEVAEASYRSALSAQDKATAALLQTDANRANLEAASRRIDQAQASIAQIDVSLGETVIVAPFDGIITEKYIEENAIVSTGTPIVSIQDPTDNWVDFKIPETKIANYKENETVTLEGRDGKTRVEGTIANISRKASFATERATSERGDATDIISFNVKVQVNSEELRPGMRFRLLGAR